MNISLDTTINELNKNGILSVRAYNAFRTAQIVDLRQLMSVKDCDLIKIRHCGRKTVHEIIEIKNRYEKLLADEIIREKEAFIQSHPNTLSIVKRKISYLHPSLNYKLKNWLEWRFEKLSVRAKNCVPDYVDVEKIISIAFSDTKFNYANISKCGRRTGEELEKYISDVKNFIEKLIEGIDTNLSVSTVDAEELSKCKIENEYPYLLDKEVSEIASFYIKFGNMPWLYIVYKYILRTDEPRIKMLRDYYGFNAERKSMTMEAIGIIHNISRERVRQIVHNGLSLPNSFDEYFSSVLPSSLGNISFLGDEKLEKIKLDNMLDDDMDAILCELISSVEKDFTIVQLDKECKKYLVRKSLLENVRIKSVLHQIIRQLELRRTEKFKIDIFAELTKDKTRNYSTSVSELNMIFVDYVNRFYQYKISNNRYIIVPPKKLNIAETLENILCRNERAMSLEEMWTEFNMRYPNSSISTFESFRCSIRNCENIKAKGKTGMYVLKSWSHYYTGSITDYLEYILNELNEPIPLNDLLEYTLEQFPNTNRRSIQTLLKVDSQQRFIFFENNYVGLVNQKSKFNELQERQQIKICSFETRFEALQQFVRLHKRLPVQSSGYSDDEQSLSRWLTRVMKRTNSLLSSQKELLDKFLSEHKNIPHNGTEYRFKQMCDIIKVFVSKSFTLPDSQNHVSEYNWLMKNLENYKEYKDNRRIFFEDLLSYLTDYGFYLG